MLQLLLISQQQIRLLHYFSMCCFAVSLTILTRTSCAGRALQPLVPSCGEHSSFAADEFARHRFRHSQPFARHSSHYSQPLACRRCSAQQICHHSPLPVLTVAAERERDRTWRKRDHAWRNSSSLIVYFGLLSRAYLSKGTALEVHWCRSNAGGQAGTTSTD